MEDLKKVISEHAFFKGMDSTFTDFFYGCAKNVHIKTGETLFKEGDKADQFFLIRRGDLVLELYHPSKGPVPIETCTEGDVVGWSWLYPPFKWMYEGKAMKDLLAFQFDGECLRKKIESNHEMGYQLMLNLSQVFIKRLNSTRLQVLDLYGKTH